MLSAPLSGLWSFWRGLTRLDRAALGVTLLYGLVWLGRAFKREIPFSRFIGFLFFLSLSYLLFRMVGWTRGRLLWSLRNRLIVAYVLIAVVPILLLIVMAALSTYLLYWQLGAYLLYEDIEKRIERLEATAETLAVSLTAETAASPRTAALPASTRADLPGCKWNWAPDRSFWIGRGDQPRTALRGSSNAEISSGCARWWRGPLPPVGCWYRRLSRFPQS